MANDNVHDSSVEREKEEDGRQMAPSSSRTHRLTQAEVEDLLAERADQKTGNLILMRELVCLLRRLVLDRGLQSVRQPWKLATIESASRRNLEKHGLKLTEVLFEENDDVSLSQSQALRIGLVDGDDDDVEDDRSEVVDPDAEEDDVSDKGENDGGASARLNLSQIPHVSRSRVRSPSDRRAEPRRQSTPKRDRTKVRLATGKREQSFVDGDRSTLSSNDSVVSAADVLKLMQGQKDSDRQDKERERQFRQEEKDKERTFFENLQKMALRQQELAIEAQERRDREQRELQERKDREQREFMKEMIEQSRQAPAADVSLFGSSAAPNVLTHPPPTIVKFEGKESDVFRKWLDEFETCVTGYPDDLKLHYLTSNLTGEAMEALTSLPSEVKTSYDSLVKALLLRFTDKRTPVDIFKTLTELYQKPNESVVEYYSRFQRAQNDAALLAGQDTNKLLDMIDAYHFLLALNKDVRPEVTAQQFTMKQVLELARKREDKQKMAKAADSVHSEQSTETNEKQQFDALQVQSHPRQQKREPIVCHECNKEGHIRRDCPYLYKEQRARPPSRPQNQTATSMCTFCELYGHTQNICRTAVCMLCKSTGRRCFRGHTEQNCWNRQQVPPQSINQQNQSQMTATGMMAHTEPNRQYGPWWQYRDESSPTETAQTQMSQETGQPIQSHNMMSVSQSQVGLKRISAQTSKLTPADNFVFHNLPKVASDLKRRYKNGVMKSMSSIIDSGSTNTLISSRAVAALTLRCQVQYTDEKVQLLGVNQSSECTGTVILSGAYCPSPTEVYPFSVAALIKPSLSVDVLVGNDLMEQVGLTLSDSNGRKFTPVAISETTEAFTGFAMRQNSVVKGRNSVAFAQNQSSQISSCSSRHSPWQKCANCSQSSVSSCRSFLNEPLSWTSSVLSQDVNQACNPSWIRCSGLSRKY